jgi:hypothetical protein
MIAGLKPPKKRVVIAGPGIPKALAQVSVLGKKKAASTRPPGISRFPAILFGWRRGGVSAGAFFALFGAFFPVMMFLGFARGRCGAGFASVSSACRWVLGSACLSKAQYAA